MAVQACHQESQQTLKAAGMKYYVIYMNGSLKVVPKRTIRELVAKHRFRKGVKVADIERRAIYVTH